MTSETNWQADGLCRQTDPEVFFPTQGKPGMPITAKKICAECPVWRECRLVGMAEPSGIWGGTSHDERQRFRKGVSHLIPDGWTGGSARVHDGDQFECLAWHWYPVMMRALKRTGSVTEAIMTVSPRLALQPFWDRFEVRGAVEDGAA